MSDALSPVTPSTKHRPVHTFKVPKSVGGDTISIGIIELTGDEELLAEKRAAGARPKIGVELAKQALAEVNGKAVGQADGSVDTAWDRLSPKVRTLVITAYTKLHIPTDDEMDDFFGSMEVRV